MKITNLDSQAAAEDAAAIMSALNNFIVSAAKIIVGRSAKKRDFDYASALLGHYRTGTWTAKDPGRNLADSLGNLYDFIQGDGKYALDDLRFIEVVIDDLDTLLGPLTIKDKGLLARVRFAIEAARARMNLERENDMTPDELSILSGHGYDNVMRLIYSEQLPAFKKGRQWFIRHDDAERFTKTCGRY